MKTKVILGSILLSHLITSAADFVAHEWGTFTSVQGADGVQLEWNPLITTDLPGFVYDGNRPDAQGRRQVVDLGKGAFVALQRMETPVIYFYADQEQTVNVTVRFPQGLVTEWYPQTRLNTNRLTHWDKVTILPQARDAQLLPNDGSKSHYYAARETDAALLRTASAGAEPEHEKFLFYRGVGSFRAPLQVSMGSHEDYLRLQNTGAEELRHLFVLKVRAGRAGFARLDRLGAKESKDVIFDSGANTWDRPFAEVQDEIAALMREGLIREGLYEREAAAMVETWRDSWFEEQGLRVLYVLPRPWTDRVLPLSIQPKPKQIVRVMVGRAEVITPSMEWELMKQIVKHAQGDSEAVEQFQALGLGRFADAAVRRMLGRTPNPEFSRTAWNLVETGLRAPANRPKLAAK